MKNKKMLAILLLIVGLVYANGLFSGFVWDDRFLIVKKQAFFSHPGNAIKIFTSSDSPLGEKNPYYRPLNTFSYMLDHYLWGLHPFWYHLENILLHVLVTMLFYLLLVEVFEDNQIAFIASFLFAVYPVNAEAVDFVSSRNTLFCAAFSVASLLFLAKGGRKWTLLSFVAYFLALLSKEPAVVLPFFLLSLELTGGLSLARGRFKIKKGAFSGFFAVTAVYFLIRHYVLGVFTSAAGVSFSLERMKFISAVLFEHFRLMIFPYHLNALYGEKRIFFTPLKAASAIIGILFLLYFSVKKEIPGPVKAGAQWILWGLLPVSNLVKIPSAPVAERYQYTIVFGFVLMLGYLLAVLQKRWTFAGVAVISVFVMALGIRTFERNSVWHDNMSLYSSMVRSDPLNPIARSYLGLSYEKEGSLGKAAQECGASLRLDPAYGDPYVCLGLVYAKQGRLEESLDAFQKAVKVAPDYDQAHMDLGIIYMKENGLADAEREFRDAAALNPENLEAHMDLAELYLKQGRMEDARRQFQTAIELDKDNAMAHDGLGLAFAGDGDLREAVREFRKALAIDPRLADAGMNLGVAYVKEGRYKDAAAQFQNVIKLYPGNAQALEYLGRVKMVIGDKQ